MKENACEWYIPVCVWWSYHDPTLRSSTNYSVCICVFLRCAGVRAQSWSLSVLWSGCDSGTAGSGYRNVLLRQGKRECRYENRTDITWQFTSLLLYKFNQKCLLFNLACLTLTPALNKLTHRGTPTLEFFIVKKWRKIPRARVIGPKDANDPKLNIYDMICADVFYFSPFRHNSSLIKALLRCTSNNCSWSFS